MYLHFVLFEVGFATREPLDVSATARGIRVMST